MAAKKKAAKGGSKKKAAAKRTRGDDKGGKSETAQSDRAGNKANGASSIGVNRGHIFALRPRVNTAFTPGNFDTAKHFLRDESYASIEEAAQAVVEKALELTNKSPSKRGRARR